MANRRLGRGKPSTMLACIVTVAAIFGFVALTAVARTAKPYAFDTQILLAFRQAGHPDTPLGPLWLQEAVRDITSLGGTVVIVMILASVVAYLVLIRRPVSALFVFSTLVGGQILSSVLKLAVDRPRPDIVSHLAPVSTLSFPSGHAMMSAVIYLTLGLLAARSLPERRLKVFVMALAVLVTFLVGISRLYLGVHWPSDVMAGWCAGLAWVLLCWLAGSYLRQRP